MIDYGLKDKVAIITGANNPWGIGAATAIAFAREGAKVVLVYKKVDRPFDATKMDRNGVDRYYGANAGNAGNADAVESKLKEMGADYIVLESDISNEDDVKNVYSIVLDKYGRIDILFNNAATDDETGCDTIETITQYENQNSIVNEAVSEGNNYNLFMFKKGEVVPAGVQSNNEHMYSFDYAYKIDAAREYLFTKTKNNNNQQVNFSNDGKEKLDEGKNEEALELFLDGCIASDKKAPRYIGYMYENGILLSQNDIQASIFYHIGTTRDDITSYYYLGLMYLQGKGVNQNTERAKEYFEKAANSGNENATGVKEAKVELDKLK